LSCHNCSGLIDEVSLQKAWEFRVGTWNTDSLSGRAGEVIQTLSERRINVACVQETRWKGSVSRFVGCVGERFTLFWCGCHEKTGGVGIFVAEQLAD